MALSLAYFRTHRHVLRKRLRRRGPEHEEFPFFATKTVFQILFTCSIDKKPKENTFPEK